MKRENHPIILKTETEIIRCDYEDILCISIIGANRHITTVYFTNGSSVEIYGYLQEINFL